MVRRSHARERAEACARVGDRDLQSTQSTLHARTAGSRSDARTRAQGCQRVRLFVRSAGLRTSRPIALSV